MNKYLYRNMDMRANTKERKLCGYFAVFDDVYEIFSGLFERIDPHAFDECLDGDIRCLWNHDHNIVLGRTKADTLKLTVDAHGLYGEVIINENDRDALNALARIERGDVSQCSIGFLVEKERHEKSTDGGDVFVLEKIELFEVSPVTFPAYKSTEIEARKRSLANRENDEKKALFSKWKEVQKNELKKIEAD